MTSGEIVFLMILGAVALSMFKRKKTPKVVFIEVFERFEVRRPGKLGRQLVNLAIVAAVVLVIWAVGHQ